MNRCVLPLPYLIDIEGVEGVGEVVKAEEEEEERAGYGDGWYCYWDWYR